MLNYSELQKQARAEIKTGMEIWTNILQETFGERLRYAYAKGSAVKSWDSIIDYVPEISDIDIHFRFTTLEDTIFSEDPFSQAMTISSEYERRFLEELPDAFHMPRTQLFLIDLLMEDVDYVPPRMSDIHVMIGTPKQIPLPSVDTIRSIDTSQLQSLETYLKTLPMSVIDRAGFDFWSIIRRMTWRVSPSPVRLLTQTHPDPLEVWSWNRSTIVKELEKQGLDDIANAYINFYKTGWQLFLSDFKDNKAFRDMVKYGYEVLNGCLAWTTTTNKS
ncbi:MAG: hypothetical protein ACTSU3_02635 [Candidatus Thorarchaeota archaeon]